VSTYRNLLHHFVHQQGQAQASTFWAGCGAVRRDAFLASGGFSPAFCRPSIEDIELGYRWRAAGAEIRLAKHIQVKHLKRWTLFSMLKTDIVDRALPWTVLSARTRTLPNDLNLEMSQRVSACSAVLLAGLIALAPWQHGLLAAAIPFALLLAACNWRLYAFLFARGGAAFLVQSVLLHWMYYITSLVIFAAGTTYVRVGEALKR
jgi:hypothetical protein